MSGKYKTPPIIEAVCELRFSPDSPWDMAMPGLVYERVKEIFPIRRQKKVISVGASADERGLEQKFEISDRMQFWKEDQKALIQIGKNLLSINHLAPYPSWDEFFRLIKLSYEAYRKVVNPKNIHRIGLRYINRIEFSSSVLELSDYFEFYPYVGSKLPKDYSAFIVGIQVPYNNWRDVLKIQLTSGKVDKPNKIAIILDLDYFLIKPGEVKLEEALEWIESAHGHIEKNFEACIKDKLREIFKEVNG